MNVTMKDRRTILTQLETEPKNHTELVNSTQYNWKEIQSIIRKLRNNDNVQITLDRRYELTPSV